MKTLSSIAVVLLLCSCQKEMSYLGGNQPNDTKLVKVELPYREDPSQLVLMRDFAPMLWDMQHYKITEYYSVKKNLWAEIPEWVKDDVHTFDMFGKGLVSSNAEQCPSLSFETLQQKWKLYASGDTLKLDWLDSNYEPKTYSVVAFKTEESFTLSSVENDSKVFFTYSFAGKN